MDIFSSYGKRVRERFQDFSYFAAFVKSTIKEILIFGHRKQVTLLVLFRQILFTGFEALKLIGLIGLAIGAIIIIQGMTLLENFGQSDLVYDILIIIITKELGPLLTSFIIIARSGTAISTELGNMVVNHEVEALTVTGINPIGYLVVPRVIGVIVSLYCLSIYLNLAGLLGGYFVSSILNPLSFGEFIRNLSTKLRIIDIIVSQLKSLIFGFTIAIISCYSGLKVNFASTEVPQQTIKAVVSSLTWIVVFDIVIAIFYYNI
ncbi:MAG TPA: ABC transporter permease [Spirochaetota bacterium]|nr:ABC transporter permease [Spirochaetota bacterium]